MTLDSPCAGDDRTPVDKEDEKIAMERMTRTRFRSDELTGRGVLGDIYRAATIRTGRYVR